VTDTVFTLPSLRFAALAAQAGARSWAYQFDWSAPGSPLGACHCIELPFVFGNPDAWTDAPMLRGADPAQVEALSGAIRAVWIAFVQTGDPDTGPTWPTYLPNRQTMRFGETVGAVGDLAGITWRRMANARP
jgi:para-nitrobenzyl esterase